MIFLIFLCTSPSKSQLGKMALMSAPFLPPTNVLHNNPPLFRVIHLLRATVTLREGHGNDSWGRIRSMKMLEKHFSLITMAVILHPEGIYKRNRHNNQQIDCRMRGWCGDIAGSGGCCVANGWWVIACEAWPSDNRCISVRLIVVSTKINAWTHLPHYYWSCACCLIWRTSLRANENAVVCAMAKWWVCT